MQALLYSNVKEPYSVSLRTNRVISSFLSAGILRKSEEVGTGFYATQGKRVAKLKALTRKGSDAKTNNRTVLVSLSGILYPLYLLVGGSLASVFYFIYEISRNNHVSAVS
jgi:hypothetical protein